jgi:hypothetical protein
LPRCVCWVCRFCCSFHKLCLLLLLLLTHPPHLPQCVCWVCRFCCSFHKLCLLLLLLLTHSNQQILSRALSSC